MQRCDRNLAYFTDTNLEKLRNVITTYVWENLDVGYMQVLTEKPIHKQHSRVKKGLMKLNRVEVKKIRANSWTLD